VEHVAAERVVLGHERALLVKPKCVW
jgi:hypothetical protein